MAQLPIEPLLPDIVAKARSVGRLVLEAAPGAGKTTAVPPALVAANPPGGQVWLLEPRRVAARAAARYLAKHYGEGVGETVGLTVRHERKASKATRLMVVTEGILTRRLLDDPFLEGVGAVVLDEFHERSIHTDLALAFLRELLEVRDDLWVVVMSATLDAEPIARFLDVEGRTPCARLTAEGRAFPLEIGYLDRPDRRYLDEIVASGVRRALDASSDGHVLAFLPGAPEIKRTHERLDDVAARDVEILELYGALSPAEQDRVFSPARSRRVILATNIAETSLTIDGVRAVVDSGVEKRMRFDERRGVDVLETVRISKQSATQRAGRAGRLGPGYALRLWTKAEDAQLAESVLPEIQRVDITDATLAILAFRSGHPSTFPLLAPLPKARLEHALDVLQGLGAVEADHASLTERGRKLAALPLPVRAGALLLEAKARGVLEEGALAAALLGERDLLRDRVELPTADSDLEHRMERFLDAQRRRFDPGACRALGIDIGTARAVEQARAQLSRVLGRGGEGAPADDRERALRLALLTAYPDRVCRRRGAGSLDAVMVGGQGVRLADESAVREGELFVALELAGSARRGGPDTVVRQAMRVSRQDLEDALPWDVDEGVCAIFDREAERVRAVKRVTFMGLVLDEREGLAIDDEDALRVLMEAAREQFSRVYKPDEDAQRYLERLRAGRRLGEKHGVEALANLPDVDETMLVETLEGAAHGMRTFAELQRVDWASALRNAIPWESQRALDELVPERIEVPSTSKVRLDYARAAAGEGPPVLPVRIQEMFSARETPRIVGGRERVLLHLLGPNMRPVQVTDDLAGFWANTYAEVKKELKRRYPKHSWPDDGATAEPERRPQRRRPG